MKYQGSKARLSKYLAPIIQSYIKPETAGYLEPFVGGANMIDKIECNNKLGYDISHNLIELLNKAKNDLANIPDTVDKETYQDVRLNPENYQRWFVGLVGFCASYNGKYFGGYANNVRTKIGTVRNYTDEAIRNLKKQSLALQDTEFKCANFQDLNPSNYSNFVIYCDPPYRNSSSYKTKDFPHDGFYKWCEQMAENNTVLVSEYSMPDNFKCIWEKEHQTSLNHARTQESVKRIEKLYTL